MALTRLDTLAYVANKHNHKNVFSAGVTGAHSFPPLPISQDNINAFNVNDLAPHVFPQVTTGLAQPQPASSYSLQWLDPNNNYYNDKDVQEMASESSQSPGTRLVTPTTQQYYDMPQSGQPMNQHNNLAYRNKPSGQANQAMFVPQGSEDDDLSDSEDYGPRHKPQHKPQFQSTRASKHRKTNAHAAIAAREGDTQSRGRRTHSSNVNTANSATSNDFSGQRQRTRRHRHARLAPPSHVDYFPYGSTIRRASTPTSDPVNHYILEARRDRLQSWAAIANGLNEYKSWYGLTMKDYTEAAVYGRFVRNGPRIANSRNEADFNPKDYMHFKPDGTFRSGRANDGVSIAPGLTDGRYQMLHAIHQYLARNGLYAEIASELFDNYGTQVTVRQLEKEYMDFVLASHH